MEKTSLLPKEFGSDDSKFDKKVIFYITGVIAFFIFSYFYFFSAPSNFPKGNIIAVEDGASLHDISSDLKDRKIIRSRVAFETLVIFYGGEKHIAPGDYLFEDRLSVFEIARRIAQKDRRLAPIKVTIPEGFDNQQIAEAFSIKLKNFNQGKFLEKTKDREGYLFPDTYFFFSNDDESDVLKYLSENFDKKIKPIKSNIISFGKNEDEVIVMASLVEREAKGDKDRGMIFSGILWNRINKGMPLQVDVAMETYKKKGLPASPICNPGLEAIRAAINPVNSNYLYYLHDKDGNIHYAKTFAEHKINKLKYLK